MEKNYDCENIDCKNKTHNYFCPSCLHKINNPDYKIILCENCFSVRIVDSELFPKEKNKYILLKECIKCKEK